ncbi:putative methylmalonyl-CoA mutase small subunit [Selenomonas ruminantium subsp. lactilytica TAM6421]|uniref:Putative methylmalonyl-CoA mutase small subunit n=1 Tax=Selenomonas ruminantium subsp. lactilytica (strain NBRC 103574 / TAM6421) TaxID=927704 RepID=I0GNZ9_SELRL|nr:methylmalonyl-CoA mutase family protein [Selenomonas ruminantium]BAL82486.1 putative methylmalonyl-CoA mutase small subunit [Selenomonas ruminantium subsp. lactilytica TAM6421]
MSNETGGELDLQAILKKAEQQTDFPDVPLDEFTPPTYEEWKEACIALLKGAPFEKKMYTKTYEGITFDPMYFRKDTEDILPKNSFPGMDDFLRGAQPSGYLGKPWGIAQACDETMPAENNELLRHEQEKGSTIYHIKLDSASLKAQDVRKAAAPGDEGVSVTTLDDMHTLLNGLKLDKYPLYLYAGESALPMLSLFAGALKASGQDLKQIRGIVGADPLGELAAGGKNSKDTASLYDEMARCAKWAIAHAPGLKTVFVRSDVYSRGGANDVQESAYTLATAVAYLRAMLERGLSIEEAAGQIMFGFSMGANFFLQIAKLRALRPLWSQIVEAFGGSKEAQRMHIHARPALFFKTVYDPYVNMLRNTTEIFSGVVGGVDSFESSPFDEPIRKGDEFSRRIARNVQIILQEEFGLLQPIDPAGGSWAVETLTKQMKEKIWAEFQVIEGKGGILKALQEGYPQSEIAGVLAARFKASETRKDRIVGNNMYPNMTETLLDPRPEDMAENKKQRTAQVEEYLADIDEAFKLEMLTALKAGKDEGELAIAAALAGATTEEIAGALAGGVSEEVASIAPHRWSERFEALRKLTEDYKAEHHDNVKIFLANMGPIPQHKARADFTTGFLQVGAFEVLTNNGFPTVEEAAQAAKESGADAVVICSTDATYPEIVPELAPKLHEVLPNATVFLAGAAPKDLLETYNEAGIDEYISVKANCYKILQLLQQKKGMIA